MSDRAKKSQLDDAVSLFESLGRRAPWEVGRRILVQHDLPRGQGWEKTISKLKEYDSDHPIDIDGLAESISHHNQFGEKFVRIFNTIESSSSTLFESASNIVVEENQFSRAYPSSINPDEVDDLVTSAPVLTWIEIGEKEVRLIFSSIRRIVVRETLDLGEFPDEYTELARFDEVIGVVNRKVHCFDVVAISKASDEITVLIDFPRGLSFETAIGGSLEVIDALRNLIKIAFDASPLNFFPLLKLMYDSPDEGRVVEIAFGTSTASLKHEKMRRRHLDLRQETYHVGGKDALNEEIEPHKLSVEWTVQLGSGREARPELSFNSNTHNSAQPTPVLFECVIRNCIGELDFQFVMSRIRHFLGVAST